MSFPNSPILDTFVRANEMPLNQTNWRDVFGIAVRTNQAKASAGGLGYGESFFNLSLTDCDAYVTIPTLDTGAFLEQGEAFARFSMDARTGYSVRAGYNGGGGADIIYIWRWDGAGGASFIASYNVTLANGDKIGIRCGGNNISAYHYAGGAWNLLGAVVDATYPGAGLCGLRTFTNSAGTGSIPLDDFGCGNQTGAAFPEPGIIDNFNRVDEGPPPSASWIDQYVMGVVSNQGAARQTPNDYTILMLWRTIFAQDQEAYVTVPVRQPDGYGEAIIMARYQNIDNELHISVSRDDGSNDEVRLWEIVAGAANAIGGPYIINYQDGDAFWIQCIGTTIAAWYKAVGGIWVLLGSGTTTLPLASGYIGLAPEDTTIRFSDFGGGDYAPLPPSPPVSPPLPPCSDDAILEISDGTTTVNLLDYHTGFLVSDWKPKAPAPKDDGVWQSGPFADGRRLAVRKFANIMDEFMLQVRNFNEDALILNARSLRHLLEQAVTYWTTRKQASPVWVKAKGYRESNTRYATIMDYRAEADGYPYDAPFWNGLMGAAFDDFTLLLEHGFWQATQPGTGQCVQISGTQENWEYGAWELNTNQPTTQVRDIIRLNVVWGPIGSTRLLACENDEIWRTDDGGNTPWVASTTPPNPLQCFAMVEDTAGDIYVAGYDTIAPSREVWRSQDGGDNWVQRTGIYGATTLNSLIYRSQDGYLYLVDATGFRIARSNDGAATWNDVLSGSNYGSIFCTDDGTLLTSVTGSAWSPPQMLRSTDGTTWVVILTLPIGTNSFVTYCQDGDTIYAIDELRNVYVSADDGLTWEYRSTIGAAWTIYDLILCNGSLYACTNGGDVWIGNVGGYSWKIIFTGNFLYTLCCYNSRAYVGDFANIYASNAGGSVDVGRIATCLDEVMIACKKNIAQLSHIYAYDSTLVTWTARFPSAGFPFNLYPVIPVAGDIVYFGIEDAIPDSGPFNNLIFDLSSVFQATDWEIVWEYSDGGAGWPALTIQDGTLSFGKLGVSAVVWKPPSDWVSEAVNGVTALWVRARIASVNGFVTGPMQDNRDIYTTTWPNIDVDELQVTGDISAIMRFKANNRSDRDGPGGNEPDAWIDRMVVGLRSFSDANEFVAYLNCSDEQNPIGISVSVSGATAFADDIEAPSGRRCTHTGTGTSTWADEVTFSLGPTIARDFYGKFHAFLRAQQFDGSAGEVLVRLKVVSGSGGITTIGDFAQFDGNDPWQLIDLGEAVLPASSLLTPTELSNQAQFIIQVWSSAVDTVYLYDLILIPIDEWSANLVDSSLVDDSAVENGYLLDVDSITVPKEPLRALVRVNSTNGYVRSAYQAIAPPGPAILQTNTDQRLWFLAARYDSGVWYSEPWLCHSIQIICAPRYQSMRGNR